MKSYDHKKIEQKWQKQWAKDGAYKTDADLSKPKYYVLDMFPYPSGAGLHVGHPKGYIASDIVARKKRAEGYRVLHPMGWDAFGLPAENYAIKTGTPPQQTTDESIATFKSQISNLALSYDWDREIGSHRPDYYRWTQWLFTKFFEKGLVYKKKALVNWDPIDQTVLANEQVLPDGTAERSGAVVEKKDLEQWFYKITDYADELADNLDAIDWPESTKINQRNWIGRSDGAEIDFTLEFEAHAKVKPNYLILHGYTGRADKNFIPWLTGALEARGLRVQAPQMPDTDNPKEADQVAFVLQQCEIDEHTIIVGHSLGAIVAMKLLQKIGRKVAGLVLVAPAIDPAFPGAQKRPFWDTFSWDIDYNGLKGLSGFRIVLSDTLEKQKRGDYLKDLAGKLDAQLIEASAAREHVTGNEEPMVLFALVPHITVFTTRPDTLYGATYMVLAPEHPWVTLALAHKSVLKNTANVQAYVDVAKKKSDIDRTNNTKEKTGVILEGVQALNPATGEKIPMYIADYVLAQYGTGAIMAVPAHDERDYAFAQKFGLPVRHVVLPRRIDGRNPHVAGKPMVFRNIIMAIVRDPKTDKYLILKWKDQPWTTFVIGGVEESENAEQAARREIAEESGYSNLKLVRVLGGPIHSEFYAGHKGENRIAHNTTVVFELAGDDRAELAADEAAKHEVHWVDIAEITPEKLNHAELDIVMERLRTGNDLFTGEGVLVHSGEYDGRESAETRSAIAQKFGRVKKTYKLRDWLISRQRYWGAPIPIVYDPEGKPHAIPAEHLPWLLPTDADFLPKGTSPLGSSKELKERTERIFGAGWTPEIDTMDTFACSSWYFFRFADPHNGDEFASKVALENWLPVDLYIGGAEHTVLHLLYARFFTKGLRDMGYVSFDEPFLKLRHQGLIMAEDGRKMSKRYGNVINPDDIVEKYGADTLRVYEMFMGPFQDSIAWNTQSMIGSRRFLERVWRLSERTTDAPDEPLERLLHRTIKKVGEDIESFKFNTAISTLMIFVNEAEKKAISNDQLGRFLQVLAPFAPHISEELWHDIGHVESIVSSPMPIYDDAYLIDDTVTIAIQINGKTRGDVQITFGASKEEAEAAAKDAVAARLEGQVIARTIVVPNKLVNFVLAE